MARPENTLFFVDDDPVAGRLFQRHMQRRGDTSEVYASARDCLAAISRRPPAMLVTDLNMPDLDGFELIRLLRTEWPDLPVLAITGQSTVERAVQAMRAGATDFLKKPYEFRELDLVIERCLRQVALSRENRELKRQITRPMEGYGMLGDSPAMRKVYGMIDKLAAVDCPVILQGPSGSGKELAAHAIHDRGSRRSEPFVVVDCGGVSDTLLESELFGHRRGSFTGAERDRTGLLQAARGGTVFLDEIGNISDAMQTKLLRVLEDGAITPVGSSERVPIRARFLAATHVDLPAMVAGNRFRHDLYHRLNVVPLRMPSLDERREDIPGFIEYFSAHYAKKYGRPVRHFSTGAMRNLCARRWEGNVRELRNYVQRCVIVSDGQHLDMPEDPGTCAPGPATPVEAGPATHIPPRPETIGELEAQHIQRVLQEESGNQSRAARRLGINRTTLWRKLRQLRIA